MTPDPIMLVAGMNQNCQIIGGEDKVLSVDMTGYDLATASSLKWWLATSPYALDTIIDKDMVRGITVTGNKADIKIAASETVSIAPEIYYHEMRIVLADGSSKVALSGNVVIRKSLNVQQGS